MESVSATTMTPSWPEGVPGCTTCDVYVTEREAAYHRRDYSRATDENVNLTRHKWQAHPETKHTS